VSISSPSQSFFWIQRI